MSHLDEGTLHALLDGELETHEVAEIQAHLGSCSACGLRLREVKEFHSEADRLIGSVDLQAPAAPPRPAPMPSPPRAESETRREPPPRPQPPAAQAQWEPWNEPPPLLIPDNESLSERRMRRMRRLGWAAIIVVVAGAGFVEARKMMPVSVDLGDVYPDSSRAHPSDSTGSNRAASSAPAPAMPDSMSALARRSYQPETLAKAPAPTPQRQEKKPASPAPKETQAARNPAPAGPVGALALRRDSAARDTAVLDEAAIDNVADSGEGKAEADSAATADLASVRERAAEALAQLDREKRIKQAAAATAALDARRRPPSNPAPASAAPVVTSAATPPQAPPTMEQRAQVYLRIGLDEASRQLGGPAHVIEGLSPLFMGLVQGGTVPNADGTRPVVRVVYQDSQGRLILLDQQRLRAGQAPPPAAPLAWTIGGTAMWLRGEANADILRTYRPRVR